MLYKHSTSIYLQSKYYKKNKQIKVRENQRQCMYSLYKWIQSRLDTVFPIILVQTNFLHIPDTSKNIFWNSHLNRLSIVLSTYIEILATKTHINLYIYNIIKSPFYFCNQWAICSIFMCHCPLYTYSNSYTWVEKRSNKHSVVLRLKKYVWKI